ncbi:MAG: type II toxin-antitoxin system HicB family antitoxin [Rectinemataceae bacterium]
MVYTAIIEREEGIYVSLCPELDMASQGSTVEEAKANLAEAVELFWETADESEIRDRTHSEAYVTSFEVSVG